MVKRQAPWILIVVLLCLGTCEQWGDAALKRAAASEKARADLMAEQNKAVRAESATLRQSRDSLIQQLADTTTVLIEVRANAESNREDARRDAAEAGAEVRHLLDSLGVSTEAKDREDAAHAAETAALEEERDAWKAETMFLRTVLAADSTAYRSLSEYAAGIEQENTALRRAVGLLEQAASPGFFAKLKQNAEVGAVGVGIGAVAGFIIAEKIGGKCSCRY